MIGDETVWLKALRRRRRVRVAITAGKHIQSKIGLGMPSCMVYMIFCLESNARKHDKKWNNYQFFFQKSARDQFGGLCAGWSLRIRTVTVRPARFSFCQIGAYDFNKDRFTLSANYCIRYVYALSGVHRSQRKRRRYISTSITASCRRFSFNVVVRPFYKIIIRVALVVVDP